mgnify:FL=1
MIRFNDVTKKFGAGDPALEKINFLINRGAFVYLTGPTGSGKTTIFRLIIRDLFPTEGLITLGEWNIGSLPKSKIPKLRRKVGFVFQDLKLLFDRTVVENIMLPLELSGMNESEARRRSQETLMEVGLEGKQDMFPLQLSGGEKQRVAIARALVFEPEVILADEPTGNLDTGTSFQILDLLKSINKRGTTIFIATHDEKLLDKSYRLIVLERGKIVQDKKAVTGEESKNQKKETHSKKSEEDTTDENIKTEKEDLPAGRQGTIKLETLEVLDSALNDQEDKDAS